MKIQGQNQEMLYAACQQFLGKTQEQVRAVALETLVRLHDAVCLLFKHEYNSLHCTGESHFKMISLLWLTPTVIQV